MVIGIVYRYGCISVLHVKQYRAHETEGRPSISTVSLTNRQSGENSVSICIPNIQLSA